MTFNTMIARLVRLLAAGILCYAGFLKAIAPAAEFAAAIHAYRIVPAGLANPIAILMPYIEIWIGLALLSGYLLRWTSRLAALMFAGFIVMIGSALARGIDLHSCGCFGPAMEMNPRVTLLVDGTLLIGCLFLTWVSRNALDQWSMDAWIEHPR